MYDAKNTFGADALLSGEDSESLRGLSLVLISLIATHRLGPKLYTFPISEGCAPIGVDPLIGSDLIDLSF